MLCLDDFLRIAVREKLSDSTEGLFFQLVDFYRDIDLTSKAILDIGCGAGMFGIYARLNGAKRVVGLEPSASGSADGVVGKFERIYSALRLTDIVVLPCRIQDYDCDNRIFDIVVLYDSVNHLDEGACIYLADNDDAYQRYRMIFSKLYGRLGNGGKIMIADSSRRNLFGDLKTKHPFARSIEWHKHQPPKVWIELLGSCGFVNADLRWLTPRRLRVFNRVLSNRFASYVLNSHFRLVMEKP